MFTGYCLKNNLKPCHYTCKHTSRSGSVYLSTHVIFKSHAVLLFYILNRELWVWYGATLIQDYDYEKEIGEKSIQGHLMKVTSSKSVFFLSKRMYDQNHWFSK